MKEIYLAGGCFWGVEKYFASIYGVTETSVGYANGHKENPTYEEVKKQGTGHTETVHVVYDPEKLSLSFLLELYFEIIDPTSVNKQGGDMGPQYRTGIYYLDANDLEIIDEAIEKLSKQYEQPIVIEVEPLEVYYLAEEYHQSYLDKNPDGYCHLGEKDFERARTANE